MYMPAPVEFQPIVSNTLDFKASIAGGMQKVYPDGISCQWVIISVQKVILARNILQALNEFPELSGTVTILQGQRTEIVIDLNHALNKFKNQI